MSLQIFIACQPVNLIQDKKCIPIHYRLSFQLLIKVGGSEFDMKYHILHVFRTSIEFRKKSSVHFTDIYKLKLLTNFNVNMMSFLKGVPNYVLNLQFITPPRNDVRLISKFVKSSIL